MSKRILLYQFPDYSHFRLLPLVLLIIVLPSISWASQVTLSWIPNTESDLAGYKVYYGNASGYYPYSIDVGNQTSVQILALDEGEKYFFSLKAYDQVGNYSNFSEEITIITPVADTDSDKIPDRDEISLFLTNPNDPDSDNDGMNDGEELAYWGSSWSEDIDQDGFVNILDDDSDSDYYLDGQEYTAGLDPGKPDSRELLALELKKVDLNHNWRRITFPQSFAEAVVVAGPASMVNNDGEPAVVRIRNVDAGGFDSQIQEWDYLDGRHRTEKIQYLVLDRGRYTLPDGAQIEADVRTCSGLPSKPEMFEFSIPFETIPIVMATVTSTNGAEAVTVRIQNISTEGFTAFLQEQENNLQDHFSESVSYIAWEPSSGMIEDLTYEVGVTETLVTHNRLSIYFLAPFFDPPFVFPTLQTVNEADPATVEIYRIETDRVGICIREEKSFESDTRHIRERVGYIVIGTNPQ